MIQALERDGRRCLITKSILPHVCHIFPFAINAKVADRNNIRHVIQFSHWIPDDKRLDLLDIFAPESGELAASDKEFNLLCFSAHIHTLWTKAFIGLKWTGVVSEGMMETRRAARNQPEYMSYRVEWRVLPHIVAEAVGKRNRLIQPEGENYLPRRLVDIDSPGATESFKEALAESLDEDNIPPTSQVTVMDNCGHLVETGRLLTFRARTEDLEKVKTLIEAQWLAIQMAAISGAAGAPDELQRKSPFPFLPDPEALRALGNLDDARERRSAED